MLLPNSGLDPRCPKIVTREKVKLLLIRVPAIWGDGEFIFPAKLSLKILFRWLALLNKSDPFEVMSEGILSLHSHMPSWVDEKQLEFLYRTGCDVWNGSCSGLCQCLKTRGSLFQGRDHGWLVWGAQRFQIDFPSLSLGCHIFLIHPPKSSEVFYYQLKCLFLLGTSVTVSTDPSLPWNPLWCSCP